MSRDDALSIWQSAVDAVRPALLVEAALRGEDTVLAATRILVVGAGKAGSGMAVGLEAALADRLDRVEGLVNVPEGMTASLQKIRLHAARPQGVNEPTEAGVSGSEEMLALLRSAGPEDVAICLLSGGGSALLPAPVEGIALADKQEVTQLLNRSGATIAEMNCVRKHLSRIKGGRLADAFHGRFLLSLIISDVIDDSLDVIASGPTAPDPTTFRDALNVLKKYDLSSRVSDSVLIHLTQGAAGNRPETPKTIGDCVGNRIIGSNLIAVTAAEKRAAALGYSVLNLGGSIRGETATVAVEHADMADEVRAHGTPILPPACILSGGETTVTLGEKSGMGGRNQEYVLAAMIALLERGLERITILSGGTDGEDGPTDAAGAVADRETIEIALKKNLDWNAALRTHNAYPFFEQTGGLIETGLTGTNVMDVRVILVE